LREILLLNYTWAGSILLPATVTYLASLKWMRKKLSFTGFPKAISFLLFRDLCKDIGTQPIEEKP